MSKSTCKFNTELSEQLEEYRREVHKYALHIIRCPGFYDDTPCVSIAWQANYDELETARLAAIRDVVDTVSADVVAKFIYDCIFGKAAADDD